MKNKIIIKNVDFEKLKIQKGILLNMISDYTDADDPDQRNDGEQMHGLLALIDTIQDYAVDVLGMPENQVFNLTDES